MNDVTSIPLKGYTHANYFTFTKKNAIAYKVRGFFYDISLKRTICTVDIFSIFMALDYVP